MLEVHRHDVADLVEAAPALLAEHPPREALRLWLDRLAVYGQIKRGLAGAFHTATHKLVGFLWRIETDDSWAARTARMLDIVMRGLAATAGTG
ncbi:MAG TPA: hypothetical protein VGJ07_17600 [Rugosimonospora sp.]